MEGGRSETAIKEGEESKPAKGEEDKGSKGKEKGGQREKAVGRGGCWGGLLRPHPPRGEAIPPRTLLTTASLNLGVALAQAKGKTTRITS